MKTYPYLIVSIAVLFLSAGCRKDPLDKLEQNENLVFITEHVDSARFSTYQTFRIADSVTAVTNGQLAGRSRTAYDTSIIAAVRQQMLQRGFTEETNTATTPDIGIAITAISNNYNGVISYDNYWDYYDSYWDPYYWGYGGYNYYYPYSFGVYSVNEGALSIDMFDLLNPDHTNNTLTTLWTGLARGAGIFDVANTRLIAESLFSQSPYLQR